jgi:murein DD-endopeptidase MepM/ murein hydrolase activator NlpD
MRKYILILIFLLIPILCFAENDASLDTAKAKLNKISKKIKQNKSKIKIKKKTKKRIEKDLIILNKELRYKGLQYNRIKRKYNRTNNSIKNKKKDLLSAKNHFDVKQKQFSKRIFEIYKNKNMGVMEFIFTPRDFFSTIDSIFYLKSIIAADMQLIKDMKQEYTKLQKERQNLKKQIKRLTALKLEMKENKANLDSKKKKKKRYLKIIHSEIAKIEARNRILRKSSTEISKLIQSFSKATEYLGTGSFIKPVIGWLSSKFGYRKHPIFKRRIFHTGIDLAAPKGYKIKATDSGVVIVTGKKDKYRGYGKITIIDHGQREKDNKRISSVYAHQSRILVKVGEKVKRGQTIGWVGSTGYSTGPHLHFEIRENGRPVNPLRYIKL